MCLRRRLLRSVLPPLSPPVVCAATGANEELFVSCLRACGEACPGLLVFRGFDCRVCPSWVFGFHFWFCALTCLQRDPGVVRPDRVQTVHPCGVSLQSHRPRPVEHPPLTLIDRSGSSGCAEFDPVVGSPGDAALLRPTPAGSSSVPPHPRRESNRCCGTASTKAPPRRAAGDHRTSAWRGVDPPPLSAQPPLSGAPADLSRRLHPPLQSEPTPGPATPLPLLQLPTTYFVVFC